MKAVASPGVSVIIPAYDREIPLQRSVASALAQTYENLEILIVDDGPHAPVRAERLPPDPRIRILRHARNRGVSAARNTGIDAARGRYVAFLDSDDEWMPEKIADQVSDAMSARNPDNVFSVTQTILLQAGNRRDIRPRHGVRPDERYEDFVYVRGAIAQVSSFMLATPVARSVRFREELRQFEDQMFFIEAGSSGAEYRFIPKPLSTYHDEATSDRLSRSKHVDDAEAFLRIAKGRFSPRAVSAFQVRYLSRLIMRERPMEALRYFGGALANGALRPRYAASFCVHFLAAQMQRRARQYSG